MAEAILGVSTIRSLSAASPAIHSTCDADEMGYIGTVTPPDAMIAKSNTAHSNRVEASSPTLSPRATPSAASPLATAVTWSANWPSVTGIHDPAADLYSQYNL